MPRSCVSVSPLISLVALPVVTRARAYDVPTSKVNRDPNGMLTNTGTAISEIVSLLGDLIWYCMNCGARRSWLSKTDCALSAGATKAASATASCERMCMLMASSGE